MMLEEMMNKKEEAKDSALDKLLQILEMATAKKHEAGMEQKPEVEILGLTAESGDESEEMPEMDGEEMASDEEMSDEEKLKMKLKGLK